MAEQTRFWRQDNDAEFTLIEGGKPRASVNRDQHTAALLEPDQIRTEITVPNSREIFAEVENRLGIPTVQDFHPKDRNTAADHREQSRQAAYEFRKQCPAAREPEHYVRKALSRLTELEKSGLSAPAREALPHIRSTLAELARHDGKWNETANRDFRDATTALERLPEAPHRLEALARADLHKAHATLHQARTVREHDKSDISKDAGKKKDDPGRQR